MDEPERSAQNLYCGVATRLTIREQFEKFRRVEEVEPRPVCLQEEERCEQHFGSTHSRNSEGRFVVQLPLKDDPKQLSESYYTAQMRLKSLERRLERQSNLRQHYHKVMTEYLEFVWPRSRPPILMLYRFITFLIMR